MAFGQIAGITGERLQIGPAQVFSHLPKHIHGLTQNGVGQAVGRQFVTGGFGGFGVGGLGGGDGLVAEPAAGDLPAQLVLTIHDQHDRVDDLLLDAGGSATDYQGSLALVSQTLEQDMTDTPPGERARTRYVVVFVSDGSPEPQCRAGCEDGASFGGGSPGGAFFVGTCGNGEDDDGNGFVDDVHGIAYGPDLRPTPELLYARHPDDEVWARVLAHDEGLSDLLASIDSPAARDLQATMGALSAEEAPAFVDEAADHREI